MPVRITELPSRADVNVELIRVNDARDQGGIPRNDF